MRVAWTIPALNDLDQIQDFVAADSPSAAHRLVSRLFEHTGKLLAERPYVGRMGRAVGTRELVVAGLPYIIVYRVTERVEILAVVHMARDWPGEFS